MSPLTLQSDDLVTRHRNMLEMGEYSDLTIVCEEKELKVHRYILCHASRFFKAACENDFIEGKTGVIQLREDKLEALKRMLSYLYTYDYEDEDGLGPFNMTGYNLGREPAPKPAEQSDLESGVAEGDCAKTKFVRRSWYDSESERESDSESDAESDAGSDTVAFETDEKMREYAHLRMLNNVDVYAIADKYDLPDLKKLALRKFRRDARIWPMKDLETIVNEVYKATPGDDRGLKDVLIHRCNSQIDHVTEDIGFKCALEETAEFTSDMLLFVLEKYQKASTATKKLRVKNGAKKERNAKHRKKIRHLKSELQHKNGYISYVEAKFEALETAADFAADALMISFRSCRSYPICEFCKDPGHGYLEWVGSGRPPYLKLSCKNCNGKLQSHLGNGARYDALKLDTSLKDWPTTPERRFGWYHFDEFEGVEEV